MWDKLLELITDTTSKLEEWYSNSWLWIALFTVFLFAIIITVLLIFFAFTKDENNLITNETKVSNLALPYCLKNGFTDWNWKNQSNHSNLKFYCFNSTMENLSIEDYAEK